MILDALGEIRFSYPMELIKEILASGTNAVAVTLTDPKAYGECAFPNALEDLFKYDGHIRAHSDFFLKATRVADVERAGKEGRLALIYQLQNTTPIQKDLDRIDLFYGLGLRSLQLTYNYQNYVGAGCRDRHDAGMTTFGVDVIERMNDIGMLVDVSHAGMATMVDAVEVSSKPIIISHTACQAVHLHSRNTTDENLRRVADKGGVIGICQIRTFITDKPRENLDFYFDHIDHAVNVAGIDHVCIGSDRDHRVIEDTQEEIDQVLEEEGPQFHPSEWPLYMTGLNGPRRMEVVVSLLSRRGYSDDKIEKIINTNLFRIYEEVIG